MSMNTRFNILIGWSYQKTRDGDQSSSLKKETYPSRYVNERVEVELAEFKEEITKKFKVSKIK